ncbi:MAG: citrate synthase/methylcitrate synthase [bacterium]
MTKQTFVGQQSYSKGLEDVPVCESKIGYVDGEKGWLVYRGFEIADLVQYSSFEETSYLTLYGKLPTILELSLFKQKLIQARNLPKGIFEIIQSLPSDGNPMAAVRTGFSALGSFEKKADKFDLKEWTEIGVRQISQMAVVVGAVGRRRADLPAVLPDPELGHTANLLWMLTGKKPSEKMARVMDIAMILHVDHEMNASTFASMAVASSLADMYSAVTGGIASLKGPLHGGANEEVVKMLLEIGLLEKTDSWLDNAFASKKKISGFGHRVYRTYDPRAVILKQYAEEAANESGNEHLFRIALQVEKRVVQQYGSKGIFPNVDFFSGIVYFCYGISPELFTPLFAASRVTGWVARIVEYLQDNRLFRPRAIYTGDLKASYVPLDKRT